MRRSNSRSVQSSGSDSTMRRKAPASGPSRGRSSPLGCATSALLSAGESCPEAMASARLARLCSDQAMSGAQTAMSAIEAPVEEHRALREGCGPIDRPERGQLALTGSGSLERGLLSLIGPESNTVAGAEGLAVEEHANAALEIDGIDVLAVRAHEGVDLICPAGDVPALSALLLSRGAVAVSPAAVECRRIEQGRPRYGVDMDDTTIPPEAG